MKILADSNIVFVREAFAQFGDLDTVDGRAITRERLKDADMLLVRSVTKVMAGLLKGTGVKFVASATSGTDHVDMRYLADNHIGFAYAPGSNANSVAEYVTAAIVHAATAINTRFKDLTLGIVGVGNIGLRVLALARVLGMRCLLNDPPKRELTGSEIYLPLETVLAESDIVTLHVPLDTKGPNRTLRMVNREFLGAMRKGTFLINTSRGGVVDEVALLQDRDRLGGLVLDVWHSEPTPDPATIVACDIATPHIAGYSYDGKVRGTEMICSAACSFFLLRNNWRPPKNGMKKLGSPSTRDAEKAAVEAVMRAYPIFEDDARFRKILALEPSGRKEFFDVMRRTYPQRLEFHNYSVCMDKGFPKSAVAMLAGLGFSVKTVDGEEK
jgi:erythronate-4-phosphate dehydrogenase